MEALPIRPQTPHRSPHRTAGTVRRPAAATAHKTATPHTAAAPHKGTAAHPAVPVDPAVLATGTTSVATAPGGPQAAATSLPSQQTWADSGSPTRLPWPRPGRTGGREII